MAKENQTSPYFDSKPQSTNNDTSSETSSPFFRRLSVCPRESANLLGPLVACLAVGGEAQFPPKCVALERDERTTCGACAALIRASLQHFHSCKKFAKRWDSFALQEETICQPCWMEAEERLHYSVRHLCVFNCYMRAYEVYRAWHYFRMSASPVESEARTDLPNLSRWRCGILPPKEAQSANKKLVSTELVPPEKKKRRKRSGDESNEGSVLPRTYFVDGDGKRFLSQSSALRAFDRQRESFPLLSPKTLFITNSTVYATTSCEPLQQRNSLHSPYGLLEELFCDDPWRLIISTIFLNRTTRRQVDSVLFRFLEEWPNAAAIVSETNTCRITEVIRPLGMHQRRATGIIRFSKQYIELSASIRPNCFDREEFLRLFQCGEYAYAAYRMFIQHDVSFDPPDHMLKVYAQYLQAKRTLPLPVRDNS